MDDGVHQRFHDGLARRQSAGPVRRLQDIALALDLNHPVHLGRAVRSADRLWQMGFPMYPARRLADYRLVADDAPWTQGAGVVVEGPIGSILLLLSGRPIALDRLHGAGAERLRRRRSRVS